MQGAVLPKAQEMPVPKISTIKNVLSIGIFLAVVCYSAIYANNTFPISEGWNVNYVELIWHGKVPYRDFYYYLPPAESAGRCSAVEALVWEPLAVSPLVAVAARCYFYAAVPADLALYQCGQHVCGVSVFGHALRVVCL